MSSSPAGGRSGVSGWVMFVAIYLLIAGSLNVLWGIAALAEKRNFHESDLIFSNLSVWGWGALLVGVAQLAGAALVFARRAGGPMIAGFLAFCGLLFNFVSIGAYPVWSVALLVVDALILWACTVHSDEFV
jgi:hypothetical protein